MKGVSNIISVLVISIISLAILSILISNIQTIRNIELIGAELERSKQSIRYSEDLSVVYRANNSTYLFLILKNCGRFDVNVVEVRLNCENHALECNCSNVSGNEVWLECEIDNKPTNFSIPSGGIKILYLKIDTPQCERVEQVILRTENGNIFRF